MENQPIVFGNYQIQENINEGASDLITWDGKIDGKWILGVHFNIKKSPTGKASFHPFILFKEDEEKSPVTFKDDKVSLEIPGPYLTIFHGKVLRIQGYDINPFKPIPLVWEEMGKFKEVVTLYNRYHQKG